MARGWWARAAAPRRGKVRCRMCGSAAAWCAAHDLQEERDAGLLQPEGFDELPRVRDVGHVVGGHHRSVRLLRGRRQSADTRRSALIRDGTLWSITISNPDL